MTTTVGLVCSLQSEAQPLLAWVSNPQIYRFYHRTWAQFDWQDYHIVIVVSKVGRQHAEAATQQLIELHAPHFIINFGSAGAIAPDMKIGDVVVATKTAEYQMPSPESELTSVSHDLGSFAESLPHIQFGPIVSADQIIDTLTLKQQLFERYHALCGDYESAVVLRICRKYQLPGIAFRVITDLGNEQAAAEFQENHISVLAKATQALQNDFTMLLKPKLF